MNFAYCLDRLAVNADTISHLLRNVSAEQARWKPQPREWSLLEVINHLYDEEREDFRQRIDFTLHRPGESWPPIDPEGWAVERKYNERDLQQSLDNFLQERQASLAWLRSLDSTHWEATHRHPRGGVLRAGDLMASWVAHDFLHIRQMADLHWAYVATTLAPYETAYAGP